MWRLWLKNLLNLIPSLPLPLQRKWPLMPSGMAAWEYRHTCWRGGKERGSIEDGATRHGEVQWAAQRTRGKPRFPAAVTEVLQPSLSCVHGLRLQVFCRRHMYSNGLVCHARFGKSMARRFEDREDMTAGNSRRCRFTLAVSCIRRHFGCQKKTRKRIWIKRTCPFCTSI